MRLFEVIVISVILCIFFTVFAGAYSSVKQMDCRIEELRNKNASLSFIAESFYNTCEGNGSGFSSLEEWKSVCRSLWQLDSIEWDYAASDRTLICGVWSGPVSEGKVYYRRKNEQK